jgi:outer membrane murein-binding lipoprotein Lpp
LENRKTYKCETSIDFVSEKDKKLLNNEFALVDILVCYAGKNRNRTKIDKEVIEKALPTLYGVPIVGEYITKDDGSKDFGTHGGTIIIDDNGFKFEQTTKPYGFIPKDSVDNAEWVEIADKDKKHTIREYLKLKDCIVWEERYEELKTLITEKRNQSMEISILDGDYTDDGYFDIRSFNFSAVCILGSDVEPCFESACIGRFELDSFKADYSNMLAKYEDCLKENFTKEEKTLDFTNVIQALSNVGEQFSVISCNETTINVFDKTDYGVYAISYTKSETDGVESIEFDLDNKVEMALDVTEMADGAYSVKADVSAIVDSKSKMSVESALATAQEGFAIEKEDAVKEMVEKFNALSTEYETLKSEKAQADQKLAEYAEAERIAKEEAHKAEINSVIESYASKLGTNAEYLMYKTKVDFSKTKEQVDTDMLLILGKAGRDNKTSFSYTPNAWGASDAGTNDNATNRYGTLFDKVRKD